MIESYIFQLNLNDLEADLRRLREFTNTKGGDFRPTGIINEEFIYIRFLDDRYSGFGTAQSLDHCIYYAQQNGPGTKIIDMTVFTKVQELFA
jgi:hypothetical protein